MSYYKILNFRNRNDYKVNLETFRIELNDIITLFGLALQNLFVNTASICNIKILLIIIYRNPVFLGFLM